MLNEPVHPAKRYVNLFLLEMLHGAPGVRVARRSAALPVLQDHAPPDFDRFRNRLKVLAGLDPVAYPVPRDGTVDVGIDRQVDGQWYECVYTVSLRFTDAGDDPSVELRAGLKSQKPGIDPDHRLY